MTLDNCTHLCNHYHNQDIKDFHLLPHLPHQNYLNAALQLILSPALSQAIKYLLSLTVHLPL